VKHIRLICWNADDTLSRAQQLAAMGYEVVSQRLDRDEWRTLRENPPDAMVIDLSRLPSHGRDVGVGIRSYKSTRHVPLVFVGGRPDKVEKVKALLPDAVYTTWEHLAEVLEEAIANPPSEPVVPGSVMAAYSGTPLPKKLGIKAHSVVSLIGARDGFRATLGHLPEGVELRTQLRRGSHLTLWFVRSRSELEKGLARMSSLGESGGLWIVWPKKSSRIKSDLSENVVREAGLAAGLVDFKVCSVDETWSGLRFTRRNREAD